MKKIMQMQKAFWKKIEEETEPENPLVIKMKTTLDLELLELED